MLSLYGKHPAFGDFLSRSHLPMVLADLETWLQKTLSDIKANTQDSWENQYDTACDIRFWVGHNVLKDGPIYGIMRPSRDRVGRRFPLIVFAQGPQVLPPVLEDDQTFYSRITALLNQAKAAQMKTVDDLIEMLVSAAPPAGDPQQDPGADLWAIHPAGDLTALLGDVGRADHLKAASTRSYWWWHGQGANQAGFYACQDLPGATGLGWIFSAAAQSRLQAEEHV